MTDGPESRPSIRVQAIEFTDEGMAVGFVVVPDDIREHSLMTRNVLVSSAHEDYGIEMEKLYRRASKLVQDVLENHQNTSPFIPSADDAEDEDDQGMGW